MIKSSSSSMRDFGGALALDYWQDEDIEVKKVDTRPSISIEKLLVSSFVEDINKERYVVREVKIIEYFYTNGRTSKVLVMDKANQELFFIEDKKIIYNQIVIKEDEMLKCFVSRKQCDIWEGKANKGPGLMDKLKEWLIYFCRL